MKDEGEGVCVWERREGGIQEGVRAVRNIMRFVTQKESSASPNPKW